MLQACYDEESVIKCFCLKQVEQSARLPEHDCNVSEFQLGSNEANSVRVLSTGNICLQARLILYIRPLKKKKNSFSYRNERMFKMRISQTCHGTKVQPWTHQVSVLL